MDGLRPRGKVDSRGRVTLPIDMVRKYSVRKDSIVEFQDLGNKKILIEVIIS